MSTPWRTRVLAAALCAAASLAAGCGGGSEDKGDQRLAQFARSISAAYHCMPPAARRRYDRIGKSLERVGAPILERNRGRSAAQSAVLLRADPRYARLSVRASRMLARYMPRGSDFDAACYRRLTRPASGSP